MKYAINLNAVLPVRATASETAEMVTQLLFGEMCEISEKENSFSLVINQQDGYEGYADSNMLTPITETEFLELSSQPFFRVCVPMAEVFCLSDKSKYRLPGGSLLPNYNPDNSKFSLGNKVFQIHPSYVTYLPAPNKEGIVPITMQFLNVPYLWGGKNVMGIDCSGLVQTIFAMNGYTISRDASTQVEEGEEVDFENAEAGDLFFFSKDSNVVHVGIYMGDKRIIHASGKVKVNEIDKTGILSEDKSAYTHFLYKIRRL